MLNRIVCLLRISIFRKPGIARGDGMKPLFRLLSAAVLVSGILSGCSTQYSGPQPSTKPEASAPAEVAPSPANAGTPQTLSKARAEIAERSPAEIGQLILVWVAGYCEGWSKATGDDFERCVDTTVDYTMKDYQRNTGVPLTLKSGK